MKMKHVSNLEKNEKGFASIVIAIVMVLVLSLTTVGFVQLMQKEQRDALDKQLSSQAYYAAESGLNDALKAVNAGYSLPKTKCESTGSAVDTTQPGASYLMNPTVGSGDISYTCLLINPTPTSIQFPIDTSVSKIVQITGVNAAGNITPIQYILVKWQDAGSNTSFVPGGQSFKPADQWNYVGVLRMGLTPITSGNVSRNYFTQQTSTTFLYPNAVALPGLTPTFSASTYTGNNAGGIVNSNCNTGNTPAACVAKVTLGQANYLMDLRSVYKPTSVTIEAYGAGNVLLGIKNAQTVIDSTGRSQDVLRRLQAHVPSRPTFDHTDYGIETVDGICKQQQLYPNAIDGSNASSTNCADN